MKPCKRSVTWRHAQGLVRSPAAVAYGEDFIMPLLNDFMQAASAVENRDDADQQTLRPATRQAYDLAIRLGRLQDSSMIADPALRQGIFVSVAPAYLERHGAPHSLSELPGHNCLVLAVVITWQISAERARRYPCASGHWQSNSGKAVPGWRLPCSGCASYPILRP